MEQREKWGEWEGVLQKEKEDICMLHIEGRGGRGERDNRFILAEKGKRNVTEEQKNTGTVTF